MCETSLAGFPQSLGNSGEGHDPTVTIMFPVGSYLAASLTAHLSCLVSAFFCGYF